MKSEAPRSVTVRPASVADSAAISRVCLLTAYQGRSAEALVRHPELHSQVHALPYLHLPSGFGFVLIENEEQTESESVNAVPKTEQQRVIEDDDENTDSRNVVGYVVGTGETVQFQREVDASWRPVMRLKYPKDLVGTPVDRHFINLIHKGSRLSATGAAHIHVNVIGRYKKQGCDRLLVDAALQHLRRNSQSHRCNL